ALAQSNVQGTLYLEARNTTSESWARMDAVAVNSTGIGRLRRINIPYRYARLRFLNGDTAQTTFRLSYTLWQVTDGQGDAYGQGEDVFSRYGSLAAGTTETVMVIRSPLELQDLVIVANDDLVAMRIAGYKDNGSEALLLLSPHLGGTSIANFPRMAD